MGKILVGKTNEFPSGKMKKVSAEGKDFLVGNLDGKFFAVDDTCTHMGASLSVGQLDGSIVTCGWHGAKFDCKTGKLEKFPAKIKDLAGYNVLIESEDLFIEA